MFASVVAYLFELEFIIGARTARCVHLAEVVGREYACSKSGLLTPATTTAVPSGPREGPEAALAWPGCALTKQTREHREKPN